jgi:quercetin dioxygenase-like cupin family protein
MPFINYNEMPHQKLMDNIHGAISHSDQLTVGYITLEAGAQLPEHSHIHEQWSHVVEGELDFVLGDEKQIMTKGMSVYIPSNIPHSAKAISKCVLIDTFLPVREDFKKLESWK